MVDVKLIKQLFKAQFKTDGKILVDDQGLVHVTGNVFIKVKKLPKLPVKFGKITGHFFCDDCGLETLEGAPNWVGGDVWCQYNNLHSLEHAPVHVGNDFLVYYNKLTSLIHAPAYVAGKFSCYRNPLTSLQGVPEHGVSMLQFSYEYQMPLLRCLTAQAVDMGFEAPDQVTKIIQQHVGKGKPGALQAAGELIRAGFKDNARW
jgi:hypothetical protein